MFRYNFRLTHDYGQIIMSVVAQSESKARFMIRNAEECPDRAITLMYLEKI